MDGSVSWLLLRLMVKLAPFLSFPRLLDVAAFVTSAKRSNINRLGTRRETLTSHKGWLFFQVSVGLEFQPEFCGQRPLSAKNMPTMRIVGGKEAGKGLFPWQAQIWVQSTPGGPDEMLLIKQLIRSGA